jgi:hypothetical protein
VANPTTNYGFVLPTASDLVTDLPADFDVALQGVDTRLKALQPGTTLGDLAYSSATANTNTRLGIGSTGDVLTVTGGVPVWAAPAGGGKVLQVVQATYSVQTANSSATYVSTGLTATITPSATNSKVMILVQLPMAPNVSITTDTTIFRGTTAGTNLAATALGGQYGTQGNIGMQYLDSPSTTSAQVYTVASKQSSGTSYSTPTGYTGVIILMEIGA